MIGRTSRKFIKEFIIKLLVLLGKKKEHERCISNLEFDMRNSKFGVHKDNAVVFLFFFLYAQLRGKNNAECQTHNLTMKENAT